MCGSIRSEEFSVGGGRNGVSARQREQGGSAIHHANGNIWPGDVLHRYSDMYSPLILHAGDQEIDLRLGYEQEGRWLILDHDLHSVHLGRKPPADDVVRD